MKSAATESEPANDQTNTKAKHEKNVSAIDQEKMKNSNAMK